MFLSESVVFGLALAVNGLLVLLMVYFVMTLSDVECDYLNAVECCSRLNAWTRPRLAAHGLLAATLLLHTRWLPAALAAPPLLWLAFQCRRLPPASLGLYDPTEMYQRQRLALHLRHVLLALAYCLISFFIYLYCLIIALLKGDPLQRHLDDTIVTEL